MMEAINYSCNEDESNPKLSNINIDMNDMILTPYTCSCLVTEILKTLLYVKTQIPYPYTWLKNAISKRKADSNIHTHSVAIIVQKYFNLASNAYRCVEEISFNLNAMLSSSVTQVQEVAIMLGSTPYTPKEVFTIKFPVIAQGHNENNHRNMLSKKMHNVLRNVFLSDEWLNAMQHQLQVTNTFVFVKKLGVLRHEDDYFEHYNNFVIPANVRNTVITLKYDKKNDTCCENLHVYGDETTVPTPEAIQSIQSRNVNWYQAKGIIKGFQDFFVEKVSVSELW